MRLGEQTNAEEHWRVHTSPEAVPDQDHLATRRPAMQRPMPLNQRSGLLSALPRRATVLRCVPPLSPDALDLPATVHLRPHAVVFLPPWLPVVLHGLSLRRPHLDVVLP